MDSEKAQHLRESVRIAYSAAAERPQDEHPFPVGRAFAESLGYPLDLLATIPSLAIDAFAGVSNVSIFEELPSKSTVLNLGCGASLDSLIAAQRVGPEGKVLGVDFSECMLERARQAATEAGLGNLEFHKAGGEKLPLEEGSVDIALVNGIFNLNPDRDAIFHELARVVKPSGAVYAAELILTEPLSPETQQSEADWFA